MRSKDFAIAIIFSLMSIIFSLVLADIFDFSLTNTWQGMLALCPIFGPIYIWGWRFTAIKKKKFYGLILFIRFLMICALISYVICFLVVVYRLFV